MKYIIMTKFIYNKVVYNNTFVFKIVFVSILWEKLFFMDLHSSKIKTSINNRLNISRQLCISISYGNSIYYIDIFEIKFYIIWLNFFYIVYYDNFKGSFWNIMVLNYRESTVYKNNRQILQKFLLYPLVFFLFYFLFFNIQYRHKYFKQVVQTQEEFCSTIILIFCFLEKKNIFPLL